MDLRENAEESLRLAHELGAGEVARVLLSRELKRSLRRTEMRLEPRDLSRAEWHARVGEKRFLLTTAKGQEKATPYDPTAALPK